MEDGEYGKPSEDSRMVSFQIPSQWMPWIEEERIKRGLRTRSDFLRKAVFENIEVRETSPGSSPKTILGRPMHASSSPIDRRIRHKVHECIKRGVEYFSNAWDLDKSRIPETIQLATRTYAYLAQEIRDRKESDQSADQGDKEKKTPEEISDDEKTAVLSSSGTAVRAKMGEIGLIDDPNFGQMPEVILEFDLTPELDNAIFTTN